MLFGTQFMRGGSGNEKRSDNGERVVFQVQLLRVESVESARKASHQTVVWRQSCPDHLTSHMWTFCPRRPNPSLVRVTCHTHGTHTKPIHAFATLQPK